MCIIFGDSYMCTIFYDAPANFLPDFLSPGLGAVRARLIFCFRPVTNTYPRRPFIVDFESIGLDIKDAI